MTRIPYFSLPGAAMTAVLALGEAADTHAAPAPQPSATQEETLEFYRDIRPNHWVWNGTDPVMVNTLLERIAETGRTAGGDYLDLGAPYGPGEWTYEFEKLGDSYYALAEQEENVTKLPGAAARYYEMASAAYTLAKYPYFAGNEDQERTYVKSLDALKKAWSLRGYGVEEVEVPFEGGMVNGLMILPKGTPPADGWPIVVGSNGSDVNKGEFFSFAEDLADHGIAFLAFDILGTGSHSGFTLSADYERLPEAFLEHLIQRDDMDAARAGVLGVSFGGNAAVKLAHTRPDLVKAAINFCGPIHTVFQIEPEQVADIEDMYINTLRDRTNTQDASPEEFLAVMRRFSLVDQGVLGDGKARTNVPILSVNAYDDHVAPPADMELVNNSTTDGMIFYSGRNDHCPQDRFEAMPFAAAWLHRKLNAE